MSTHSGRGEDPLYAPDIDLLNKSIKKCMAGKIFHIMKHSKQLVEKIAQFQSIYNLRNWSFSEKCLKFSTASHIGPQP